MSKRLKTGEGKAHSAVKTAVKGSRAAAGSTLSTVGYRKDKTTSGAVTGSYRTAKGAGVEHTRSAPAVSVQAARPADPSLLDPYDWGPEGVPKGKPLQYVPGKGFVLED